MCIHILQAKRACCDFHQSLTDKISRKITPLLSFQVKHFSAFSNENVRSAHPSLLRISLMLHFHSSLIEDLHYPWVMIARLTDFPAWFASSPCNKATMFFSPPIAHHDGVSSHQNILGILKNSRRSSKTRPPQTTNARTPARQAMS